MHTNKKMNKNAEWTELKATNHYKYIRILFSLTKKNISGTHNKGLANGN